MYHMYRTDIKTMDQWGNAKVKFGFKRRTEMGQSALPKPHNGVVLFFVAIDNIITAEA
jgi:hypothetical protein